MSTVWYNYVLASAGTIYDTNTTEENPANNTTPDTESICPKGWSLPSTAQIRAIGNSTATYVPNFSPVLGGYYSNGAQKNESTDAAWWGKEVADNGARRYRLNFNANKLLTNSTSRFTAYYIRCVAKQKTITDLAYMQDVMLDFSEW